MFKKMRTKLKKTFNPSLFDLEYDFDADSDKELATPESIKEYIALGADVNECIYTEPNRFIRPIYKAIVAGNYQAFVTLWNEGAKREFEHFFKICKDLRIRRELLRVQKEIEGKKAKESLLKLDYKTATAKDVEDAIRNGADVNAKAQSKYAYYEKTPIFYAIREGNYDAFITLVENGANLTATWDDFPPSDVAKNWASSRDSNCGHKSILEWFNMHEEFIVAIQNERWQRWKGGCMLPMVKQGNDMQCYQFVDGRIVSLKDFEKQISLTKKLALAKKADTSRQKVVKLLDALDQQPPSSARKAAKVAAAKEYRRQNPKKGSR